VAILDDSVMFRAVLKRTLSADREIEVVAEFSDPLTALEQIARVRADVISVDMEMPRMRGNEFLTKVLPANPGLRAIVVSSLSGNVFDAMQAGAVDFVGKPGFQPGYANAEFSRDIIDKIKIAATAKPSLPRTAFSSRMRPAPLTGFSGGGSNSIIAIGASTGGTEAILEVITAFPADVPGVVIVQHMPPGFTSMYAERANRACTITVREAKHGDKVERGLALLAPGGDRQMRVEPSPGGGYYVSLKEGPKVSGHCPSVDVLFESVAAAAKQNAVGVLLTGMGADGANNLRRMRLAGAHTIGQDEASCVVYGMPKVAFDIGGVTEQLPLQAIGRAVLQRVSR
jgi:two-component system chemotaxis response regulator CheB